MSEVVIQTKTTTLRTYAGVLRALEWGWTVRCRLLKLQFPVGGVEFTVLDVREVDEMDADFTGEFQVLTLQGWHTPTQVWAVRPVK